MTDDTQKAIAMVRSFSALIGVAWTAVTGALLFGTFASRTEVTPVILFTLIVGIAGMIGAFAGWRLYRWGAILFLGCLLLMLSKGLFFSLPPANAGFPLGYVAMTFLYGFAVVMGWKGLRNGNA